MERILYEQNVSRGHLDSFLNSMEAARARQSTDVVDDAIDVLRDKGYEIYPDMEAALREIAVPQANRAPTVQGTVPEVQSVDFELDNTYDFILNPVPHIVVSEVTELRTALETAVRNHPKKALTMGDVLRVLAASSLTTKAEKWLAKTIAPMLDQMGTTFTLRQLSEATSSGGIVYGGYNAPNNEVYVNAVSPLTILHEAIHPITRDAVVGTLDTPEAREFRDRWNAISAYLVKNSGKFRGKDFLGKSLLESNNLKGNHRYEYMMSAPHELMTVALTDPVARNILMSIPALSKGPKTNNLWDELKSIISDYMARVFKFDGKQRSVFDEILELTAATAHHTVANKDKIYRDMPGYVAAASRGKQENQAAVTFGVQAAKRVRNLFEAGEGDVDQRVASITTPQPLGPNQPSAKKARVPSPVTALQSLWEIFAIAPLGIEKSIEEVRNNGGDVEPEYDPYYASRKFTSDMAEMKSIDNQETVEPVRNWIHNNWRKFASKDAAEFRKDLDKFMQSYHLLHERNPTIWANTVELQPGQELVRDQLIQDAYDGKIDGPTLNQRLIALASNSAMVDLETWTHTTSFAKDNSALRKQLADLKAKGFDENTLQEFNDLVQGIRDRARQRQFESGQISETDPFVDRGWEWYVPLKDHLSTSEQVADYDIGSGHGTTTIVRKNKLKVMGGRQSTASNSLTQLVEDMNNAATAAAQGDFTGKLFEFSVLVKKNAEILRSKYTKYYGTPKEGYYAMIQKKDPKTGKITYVKSKTRAELPTPRYGFIHNNGTEHYVVYLPKDSQLLRGITKMNQVMTPGRMEHKDTVGKGLKAIGTGTNILARAYTTWNPVWAAMVGFLRDTTTLPTTVAMTVFPDPLAATAFAGRYTANLVANAAQIGNLPNTLKSIWGNKAALRKYALDPANANTLFAKIYAYRQAGGSTEFEQGFNQERADDFIFGNMELTATGGLKAGYDKWNEVTSNWAALLENVGRVSAWEALVAGGMSPQEAAAISKSALDYNQSGEWGRMINIFHAFFRVSATSADTIRRAFTKPGGGADVKKMAAWGPAFMGMGYVAYLLMAAMLGDDEEGEPRINKMDAKTLTQRFVFPGPEGKATAFPIGLGLPQILLTPGILAAAVNNGHISTEEAVEAYYDVLKRTSPISPIGQKKGSGPVGFAVAWAGGMVTPTVLRPGAETQINTNSFGNLVHTAFVDGNKFKSEQGMPSTSQEWHDFATWSRENLSIDMYPEDWAHMARGYGGQMASELIRQTMDRDAAENQGLDSSAVRSALRIEVTDEEFYYRNEARQVKEELQDSRRLMDANTGDNGEGLSESRWLSRNPQHRTRIAELRTLEAAQKKYYEDIAAIRANRLLAPEGRRLQKKRADARLREAVNRAQRALDRTAARAN